MERILRSMLDSSTCLCEGVRRCSISAAESAQLSVVFVRAVTRHSESTRHLRLTVALDNFCSA